MSESEQTIIAIGIDVRRDLYESGALPPAIDFMPREIAKPAEDATEAEWDAYGSEWDAENPREIAADDAQEEAAHALEVSYTDRLAEAIWAEGQARGFRAYATRGLGDTTTETPADDQGDTWERIIWQAAWDRINREDAEAEREAK